MADFFAEFKIRDGYLQVSLLNSFSKKVAFKKAKIMCQSAHAVGEFLRTAPGPPGFQWTVMY